MSIEVLKADVIDQIAAGEVVERPAHLVKELIENSLDARASRIEIEVSEGGRHIRVSDDGIGMSKEDLALACARHATSKIRSSDDLWSLHTFGFRGEALASIGAVSDLKIVSKNDKQKNAFMLECRFGKLSPVVEQGTQKGTMIEVRELFENVPARLKFLKSEVAEVSQIKNSVKAIALSHPHVEFVFTSNGKLQFMLSKTDSLLQRTKDVMEVKDVFSTEHTQDGYSVEIVYSSPNTTVKTSRQIWAYVQNRWVNDKTVQAAVMESYRNLMMHGEYPIVVVKLQVPADEVDVNIHPTKSQVKFLEQSRIFKLVHHALRKDLEKARWIDSMRASAFDLNLSSIEPEVPSTLQFNDTSFERTQYSAKKMPLELSVQHQNPSNEVSWDTAPEYFPIQSENVIVKDTPSSFWSLLRVVGQVHLTYIVAESSESLFLIDLHAAHERVLFERLMESYSNKTMDVQNFLIPIAVDLSAEHCEIILKNSDSLAQLGVTIAVGGPETILVESAPSWIKDKAIVDAITKFAEDVSTSGGSFTWEKKLADIFATLACHSAIRAGHSMSIEEMTSLLKQMDNYALSSYCPHGRNVYVEIPKTKLERDFGRLV